MERALYFLDINFWSAPILVVTFVATLFLIVLVRYLIIAYGYHVAVIRRFRGRIIEGNKSAEWKQWNKEIRWSMISSLIFAVLAAGCYWAYQSGWTKIYTEIENYSLAYFFFTIGILLFLYESYYYWLHRWMHRPGVFRIVHKVHHDSIHTSVFTSFSFHPIEALLQFLFIPLIIVIMPVHYLALGTVLMLMTVSAVINHGGAEIFPKNFHRHRIGKWLIGATHHDLHHKEFRHNFGLYFTFWDKWMKTESETYDSAFDRNTKGSPEGVNQSR